MISLNRSFIFKFIVSLFVILLAVENNNSFCQLRKNAGSLKSELRQAELSAPLKYISITDFTWNVNLAANTVVKGHIKNSATLAGFKNITLRATFKTKTGSYIADETFAVLEFLPAGRTIDFRRTITGWWKDAKLCSVEVVAAERN